MSTQKAPALKASTREALTRPGATAEPATQAVDSWITQQVEFAQPILRHLRETVHEAAPDATEELKWSRPFFVVQGTLVCYMAAFTRHCGFGFWSPEMTAVLQADGIAEPGASGSFGKITSLEDLPPRAQLLRYIRHAADRARAGTAASPMNSAPRRTSAKAPIAAPPEFTAALAGSKPASATFSSFSKSCQREYLEWIVSAKKDETKARRIQQAVEQLAAGKRFNEQHRAAKAAN